MSERCWRAHVGEVLGAHVGVIVGGVSGFGVGPQRMSLRRGPQRMSLRRGPQRMSLRRGPQRMSTSERPTPEFGAGPRAQDNKNLFYEYINHCII